MFLEANYLKKELTDDKIEKDMKPLLLLSSLLRTQHKRFMRRGALDMIPLGVPLSRQ